MFFIASAAYYTIVLIILGRFNVHTGLRGLKSNDATLLSITTFSIIILDAHAE